MAREVSVGEIVRTARVARRLSVRALAAATGVSLGFISQVGGGQASPSVAPRGCVAAGRNRKVGGGRPMLTHRLRLLLLLLLLLPAGRAAAQPACDFVMGFAALRAAGGPETVGDCLENQRPTPAGDVEQRTTGGLLVWRKADNWTAFTDGQHTWVLGPEGLQRRPNTERFAWERSVAALAGGRAKWETVELSFPGPMAHEGASSPNPFLDYRLRVTFAGPAGQTYRVPGFFDGDGQGGGTGNVWKVRFTAEAPGTWSYVASFRSGPGVAIELADGAGSPSHFDGDRGAFDVANADAGAAGLARWGRLEYVGTHYLKFRDGPYWIKGSTNEPENFLAYGGFDATVGSHGYAAHVADWRPGNPDWNGGAGRGIIGALNYLGSVGANSLYLLPMNIGGDGKDVWPFVGPVDARGSDANDNLHYDVSKLRQWEIVFAHAQRQGIVLQVVLNEAEQPNKTELDGGALGTERRLYYRELIARFGHHNGLIWNVSEEYDLDFPLPPEQIRESAGYIRDLDPYDHPITVHNWAHVDRSWAPFLGDRRFDLTSFQWSQNPPGDDTFGNGAVVEEWRRRSWAAGRPLPISLDEPRMTTTGNLAEQRKDLLWPTYLSGGSIEFIVDQLLGLEDFRTYEPLWRWTWYARRFMEEHLPYWEMEPDDALLSAEPQAAGQALVKAGEVYALYLPSAQNAWTLDLSGAPGDFEQRWFDPRQGRFVGPATTVVGGGPLRLEGPPADPAEDWAVLLRRAAASGAA